MEAGAPRVRDPSSPHLDMRRTYATWSLAAGVSLSLDRQVMPASLALENWNRKLKPNEIAYYRERLGTE